MLETYDSCTYLYKSIFNYNMNKSKPFYFESSFLEASFCHYISYTRDMFDTNNVLLGIYTILRYL